MSNKYISFKFRNRYYGGPNINSRFIGAVVRNSIEKVLQNLTK